MDQPSLTTARLRLRSFELSDGPAVERLAGAYEVALNTLLIPHPYPEGAGAEWIATHAASRTRGSLNYALVLREGGALAGAIGLSVDERSDSGEIGYWVGVEHWGKGYCSEAGRALLAYAFGELGLNRVHAHHFARNPASGRVMQKLGMRYEGTLRQHIKKWGEYQDLPCYGILRAEWSP
jgi:[ribosomal protein S5]-alanine N-acetyltransferase